MSLLFINLIHGRLAEHLFHSVHRWASGSRPTMESMDGGLEDQLTLTMGAARHPADGSLNIGKLSERGSEQNGERADIC